MYVCIATFICWHLTWPCIKSVASNGGATCSKELVHRSIPHNNWSIIITLLVFKTKNFEFKKE